MMVLFFKNSSAASEWVSKGLKICVTKLIPSLFPFMVLSSIAIFCKIGRLIPKCVQGLFAKCFGVGGDGACAIALGWICGFPIGARCAVELLRENIIDAREYKKLVCISSTPSPAFLIGAVGKGMLGDTGVGVLLYLISLLSSTASGIILSRIIKTSPCVQGTHQGTDKVPLSKAFSSAVSQSAMGMLSICGFVVFFCAFLGALESIAISFGASEYATAVMFSLFELTTALSKICSFSSVATLPLCALAVGWSGFSVHFQTFSVCSGAPVGTSLYLGFHALRSVICLALSPLFMLL
ncbi:MAG: hypothetical protein J6U86_02245 [Clostridia bacterium]|nr:hypothetical protein [Clostridia bacterium]